MGDNGEQILGTAAGDGEAWDGQEVAFETVGRGTFVGPWSGVLLGECSEWG